jgi:hypothetical protein
MFIQPSLTQNQVDVIVPVGEYISIGNTGNEPTAILLRDANPGAQSWNYAQIGSLSNSAQTFGPYTQERTVRIQNRNATVEYSIGVNPQLRSLPTLILGSVTPIRLVEVASTFIDPAVGDDNGNTSLVSDGSHGLTAAIAVGSSVYVTWTGGTAVTGFYKIISIDVDVTGSAITINLPYVLGLGDPVVAVADTEITIASVTVPGWAMGTGGEFSVEALFNMTSNATAKTLGMTYGGQPFLSASAANNASAFIQKVIYNRGASRLITNSLTSLGHGLSAGQPVELVVDTAVDQVFAITVKPEIENNVIGIEVFQLHIEFS